MILVILNLINIKNFRVPIFYSWSIIVFWRYRNLAKFWKLNDSSLKYLKDIFIFDFYTNQEKNITKLGYRFIFQSVNKTLTDQDIDLEMNKLYKIIKEIDGVSIPGLILWIIQN